MTRREARRLARKIDRTVLCRVEALRCWGRRSWELEVTDTKTGYTFVVSSIEDWQKRVRASELAGVRDEIP